MPLYPRTLLKVAAPVAVLALGMLIFAGLRATRPQLAAKPVAERVWTVAVAEIELGALRPVMNFEGEVVAGREAELRPLVAGPIVELHPNFAAGGRLCKGDTVLRVDPFAYQAAVSERKAELAEARARVDELDSEIAAETKNLGRDRDQWALARQELERRTQLRSAGTVSDRSLEEARLVESERQQRVTAREQAIARNAAKLEQARAAVGRLEWALKRAERSLADTTLVAPFDGFLHDTDAAVGKQVAVSDRLGRLIEATTLEVRFHVPDHAYARLSRAPLAEFPAEVHWRVGDSERVYPAVLDRVDSKIKSASGGVLIYARLTGLPAATDLRPGAFVTVAVTDRGYEAAARLPARALHDGDTVYVVSDGRLAARKVEMLAREGGDLIVRGDLAAGDRVVTTRFPEIAPGVRVAVP